MVLGVGADILKIDSLSLKYLEDKDPFLQRTYTTKEQEEAKLRDNPCFYYATRFSGKEAVYKSLNWKGGYLSFCDIEILNHENGQPYVTLNGTVKEYAESIGITEILISLSYDTDYAIAYAIAQ